MLPEPDANNVWRLETPGNEGWDRSARPDAVDKFYMASADGHVQEPGEGDSAKGYFTGQWQGVVRPLLDWTTREL